MGDFIKKILSEEVHPDYDYIDEGDELLTITPRQVKMILSVFKKMDIKYFNNDHVRIFITNFEVLYHITGGTMLSKLLLVAYFNPISDLVRSVERKDTSQLYNGPFYSATMDYWEDGIDEDSETQSDDCENCDGYGYVSSECSACQGTGVFDCDECESSGYVGCETCDGEESEEEDDECETCDDVGENACNHCDGTGEEMCGACSGNGEIEDDCDHCDGSGSHVTEIEKYTANAFNILLIGKDPINVDGARYTNEVLGDGDLLHGDRNWENEEISYDDDSEVSDLVDTITDIHSEDIIVNGETITSHF
tara:strand:- start:5230 stop:6153 length:924 start_codon:yes stop_codon:yes gene_type:complete